MGSSVEQIKERLGIADVVGSYIKLERAGASLKAKCPFHNERTPSFFVSPARGSYYCFGCQKGGDIFSFVQEFEGLDFVGALRVLAGRAGVELRRVDPKIQSEYARLYLCLEKATRFFENGLLANAEAEAYLTGRGLTSETKKSFRLGFAPNEWRLLFNHLSAEGFTPSEMEKVGLVKRVIRDGRTGFYDAFRGRIMFPITDSASRVIAFSGRLLPSFDDGKTGKYINSPEGALFRKSAVLYGFDKAKLAIRQKDQCVLVEGQMDLVMAHQAGYTNTVASSGTALTTEHLNLLKRLTENLLVSFDSDAAGVKASERAIQLALSFGMNVRVIALKEKDPAELIAKNQKEWSAAVSAAKHIIDFLLDGILESTVPEREKALAIEKKLLPFLCLLPSKVEQAHFVKTVAERAGLREEALWDAFKKFVPFSAERRERRESDVPRASDSRGFTNSAERRVAGLLFAARAAHLEETAARIEKRLQDILSREEYQKFLERHGAAKDSLLAEVELSYGADGAPIREEEELLRRLEEEELSARLAISLEKLSRAERDKNPDTARALLFECKQLSERLETLKAFRFAK